jgi:cell division protein FtsQ
MWDDARQMNAVAVCVAIAALALLAWAAVAWTVRQPVFAFREVVIYGPLVRANPAHLEAVIREELRGTFFTMRLSDARGSLSRVPWVRGLALRRAWPSRLEVTVTEHEPLARWNDSALVNTHGETFTADYDGELPQFTGPDGSAAEVAMRFREFGEMLRAAELGIAEIRLSARGGWRLKTEGGNPLTLELGRVEAGARLTRFIAYYGGTVGRLQRARVRVDQVDLRYRNGFAARMPGFKEPPAKKPA